MIEAKLSEVRDAFRAFAGTPGAPDSGIASAPIPAPAAFRVGRLVAKLRAEVEQAEEAHRKAMLDAGATPENGQLVLTGDEKVRALTEQIQALYSQTVKIDAEPIEIGLFGDAKLTPVDCALAGKFLKE